MPRPASPRLLSLRVAGEHTESDWRKHRELCEELRAICVKAVGECDEMDTKVRENKHAVGSIEPSRFDESYLDFLSGQIALEPRGPEWSARLKVRRKNLSPYVNRELAHCRFQSGAEDYSIYVEPLSGQVIHWERYDNSH